MSSGVIDLGNNRGPWRYYRKWSGADDSSHKAWNNYSLSMTTSRGTRSKLCFAPNNTAQYYAQCGSFSSLLNPWDANDDLMLLNGLADNIRRHQFNYAIAVGEFKSTARMVLGTLDQLLRSVTALRKGKVNIALRELGVSPQGSYRLRRRFSVNDLAGTWLAMSYGWLPLLRDVSEAMKAYAALKDPPITHCYSKSMVRTCTGNSSPAPSNWACVATRKVSRRYTVEIEENLSMARSLGLLDPAQVAWELVPGSFIADWFLPIGTYLNAISVLNAVKVKRWRLTTKDTKVGKVSHILNTAVYCSDGFARQNEDFTFTRTVGTGQLSVPLPRPRGLSHLGQVATAAALIFQRSEYLRTELQKLR